MRINGNGVEMVNAANNTESFYTGFKSGARSWDREVRHIKLDDEKVFTAFYSMGDLIGTGTFGNVYEVKEIRQKERTWAMKIVNKLTSSRPYMNALQREIGILKILFHPHIIRLHEILESVKKMYLVFEKCHSDLRKELVKNGKFNDQKAKRIILDLTSAVSYLHKNDVIHRDIKLENVLLTTNPTDENDKYFIKLTDFGLSIQKTVRNYTDMLHDQCGTLLYMAPEILQTQSYSQQCDIWSVGIILYLLLTGSAPFRAAHDTELIVSICDSDVDFTPIENNIECKDFLQRVLSKNPAVRSTANEMLNHPWLLDKPMETLNLGAQNILDMMRMWNKESSQHVTYSNEDIAFRHYNPASRSSALCKEDKKRQSIPLSIQNVAYTKRATHSKSKLSGKQSQSKTTHKNNDHQKKKD